MVSTQTKTITLTNVKAIDVFLDKIKFASKITGSNHAQLRLLKPPSIIKLTGAIQRAPDNAKRSCSWPVFISLHVETKKAHQHGAHNNCHSVIISI